MRGPRADWTGYHILRLPKHGPVHTVRTSLVTGTCTGWLSLLCTSRHEHIPRRLLRFAAMCAGAYADRWPLGQFAILPHIPEEVSWKDGTCRGGRACSLPRSLRGALASRK